jgi:hypothetical protein
MKLLTTTRTTSIGAMTTVMVTLAIFILYNGSIFILHDDHNDKQEDIDQSKLTSEDGARDHLKKRRRQSLGSRHFPQPSRNLKLFEAAGSNTDGNYTVVDATTLHHKVMIGYQGWFETETHDNENDSHSNSNSNSNKGRWKHWCRRTDTGACDHMTFDAWPDTSEYDPQDLVPLEGNYSIIANKDDNNSTTVVPAKVFSSLSPGIVDTHFRWMQEYGLDGVVVQRFLADIQDNATRRDQVLRNVMDSAAKYGRTFCIMYDISGSNKSKNWVSVLLQDWKHLVDDLGVTTHDRYLHHNGLPLLGIWGMGFSHTPGTPAESLNLVQWLNKGGNNQHQKYKATVLGGVATHWRQRIDDAKSDDAWAELYRAMDIVSPWTVGRMDGSLDNADKFANKFFPKDLAECEEYGMEYMPVVSPGFSISNLKQDVTIHPVNEVPRYGGNFFWRQFYNAYHAQAVLASTVDQGVLVQQSHNSIQASPLASSPVQMVYVAMFDEVDEATAIFKVASTQHEVPQQGSFLSLDMDQDYPVVPSDWYLHLTGVATAWLHRQQQDSSSPREFPKEMPSLPSSLTEGSLPRGEPSTSGAFRRFSWNILRHLQELFLV